MTSRLPWIKRLSTSGRKTSYRLSCSTSCTPCVVREGLQRRFYTSSYVICVLLYCCEFSGLCSVPRNDAFMNILYPHGHNPRASCGSVCSWLFCGDSKLEVLVNAKHGLRLLERALSWLASLSISFRYCAYVRSTIVREKLLFRCIFYFQPPLSWQSRSPLSSLPPLL